METSTQFDEVLNLVKRRRRTSRSLESVCSFVTTASTADSEWVVDEARKLLQLTARRYGCTLATVNVRPADRPDHVTVTLGAEEHVVLSELPTPADELREMSWCLTATSSLVNARSHTRSEDQR